MLFTRKSMRLHEACTLFDLTSFPSTPTAELGFSRQRTPRRVRKATGEATAAAAAEPKNINFTREVYTQTWRPIPRHRLSSSRRASSFFCDRHFCFSKQKREKRDVAPRERKKNMAVLVFLFVFFKSLLRIIIIVIFSIACATRAVLLTKKFSLKCERQPVSCARG